MKIQSRPAKTEYDGLQLISIREVNGTLMVQENYIGCIKFVPVPKIEDTIWNGRMFPPSLLQIAKKVFEKYEHTGIGCVQLETSIQL